MTSHPVAEGSKPTEGGDRRERVRLIGLAVAIVALVVLLADNRQSVRIGYVVGDVRAPLFVVLAVAAVLGAVVDRLLQWRTGRTRGKRT